MIRYDLAEFEPPAPVADLEVSNPVTHAAEMGRGKLDTGADISVIPDAWAAKLHLMPAGFFEVASFDGKVTETPAFYVNVSMNGFWFEFVKVLSSPRTNALLGRDILNMLRVMMDGKNLTIHVSDP